MVNKHLRAFLRGILCLAFWLLVWHFGALILDRSVVLPTPISVAKTLLSLMGEKDFFLSCFSSLGRIFAGLFIGIVIGVLLAVLCRAGSVLRELISPAVSTIKATPIASIIILMFFIFSKNTVPVIASFLMVIPIVFTNVYKGFSSVPAEEKEIAKVFRFSVWKRLKYCVFPAVLPYFSAACKSSLGLAWKAGIAAEVICTPKHSIGIKLSDAKVYLESEALFAWTIVVIILSILIEKFIVYLLELFAKKGGGADVEI